MSRASMWSKNVDFVGGELTLAGLPASQLALEFGTPTFFLDEDAFRSRAVAWRDGLRAEFGDSAGHVFYASKSFSCTAVAHWIEELGLGIDVSTGGEFAVAIAGGVSPSRIQVHGNNKSQSEIDRAVSAGVNTIVIDSLYEIDRVASAAQSQGKRQSILIRLTPGIEAHTHESISTAHEDVKFGFSIASGAAWAAVEKIAQFPELELRGVHCHIGSQIFGTEAFEMAAEIMKDKSKAHEILVKEELGINAEELQGSAAEAAIYSFLMFAVGAIIPILPFFFVTGYKAVLVSVAASTVGLFFIGAAITLFTGKSVWFSGFRQVLFGLIAAAITFGIGKLIGISVG